ncbi:hypothetical protein ACTHHL_16205 [Aeribacillus composti]|nr:hypothetical protein [Aeribacillus composti]MED0747760.1 hypothetical protein [Aeribacillus composti]
MKYKTYKATNLTYLKTAWGSYVYKQEVACETAKRRYFGRDKIFLSGL